MQIPKEDIERFWQTYFEYHGMTELDFENEYDLSIPEETKYKVWVFGKGGFSKEIEWLIKESNYWNLAGFIDINDETYFHDMLDENIDTIFYAVIGIGTPKILKKIHKDFSRHMNLKWPTIVHPSVIGDLNKITFGEGCLICAGNIFTVDINIGNFNIINLNSTLGHDLNTGDYCVINPNCSTSADTKLEGENLIGVGATILAQKTIGYGATVGAGSVVTKNVPPGETWVGVPAKKLEK